MAAKCTRIGCEREATYNLQVQCSEGRGWNGSYGVCEQHRGTTVEELISDVGWFCFCRLFIRLHDYASDPSVLVGRKVPIRLIVEKKVGVKP